jgi:hypothetical protein
MSFMAIILSGLIVSVQVVCDVDGISLAGADPDKEYRRVDMG